MQIPFHVPFYDEDDVRAMAASVQSGRLVGDGPATQKATAVVASLLQVKHALLTTSCSHALELAMMTLDLHPGDEVIVPSFTFVSSTNAILRQCARPVFADILPDTLTLGWAGAEKHLSSRTRAIMPIVYAGISPDIDPIKSVASARGIIVVEDAAQGIGAEYRGRPAGTTGHMGCFSFHETKNISTGEGGLFVTNDDQLMSKAEIVREKGTNRKQFMLGLVDKYTWVDTGSSFLPPDSMAALLMSQLMKLDGIQQKRKAVFERYMDDFAPLADRGCLTLPVLPAYATSNYHIFHVLMETEAMRNQAIVFFREKGIGTAFHYLPLHLSPVGQRLGYAEGDFPVTESVSGRLLRLPLYPSLTEDAVVHVMRTMHQLFA
jgi:dTDP-4-amino-4,6-dideoxygalactose transaminase